MITGQPILLMTLRCFEESWRVYGWHILQQSLEFFVLERNGVPFRISRKKVEGVQ